MRYRIVAGDKPTDHSPFELDRDECSAYGDEAVGDESRDGDVVCSRVTGHDGLHWDGWSGEAWEYAE